MIDPSDPDSPYEYVQGFFPEHPDPVVSDSAAIILITACETRNIKLVRYALSLTTALGCPDEVMTNVALHGAMRLRTIGTDDVLIHPWHFRRVEVETGEHLWTFDIDGETMKTLYRTAEAKGYPLTEGDLAPAIVEARRSGTSICTAANDPATEPCDHIDAHEHDAKATQTLVDSLQAHWPVDEEPAKRWVGIARMAMCCAELAHFSWGGPAGFQRDGLDDDE